MCLGAVGRRNRRGGGVGAVGYRAPKTPSVGRLALTPDSGRGSGRGVSIPWRSPFLWKDVDGCLVTTSTTTRP